MNWNDLMDFNGADKIAGAEALKLGIEVVYWAFVLLLAVLGQ